MFGLRECGQPRRRVRWRRSGARGGSRARGGRRVGFRVGAAAARDRDQDGRSAKNPTGPHAAPPNGDPEILESASSTRSSTIARRSRTRRRTRAMPAAAGDGAARGVASIPAARKRAIARGTCQSQVTMPTRRAPLVRNRREVRSAFWRVVSERRSSVMTRRGTPRSTSASPSASASRMRPQRFPRSRTRAGRHRPPKPRRCASPGVAPRRAASRQDRRDNRAARSRRARSPRRLERPSSRLDGSHLQTRAEDSAFGGPFLGLPPDRPERGSAPMRPRLRVALFAVALAAWGAVVLFSSSRQAPDDGLPPAQRPRRSRPSGEPAGPFTPPLGGPRGSDRGRTVLRASRRSSHPAPRRRSAVAMRGTSSRRCARGCPSSLVRRRPTSSARRSRPGWNPHGLWSAAPDAPALAAARGLGAAIVSELERPSEDARLARPRRSSQRSRATGWWSCRK